MVTMQRMVIIAMPIVMMVPLRWALEVSEFLTNDDDAEEVAREKTPPTTSCADSSRTL